ncbi:hypothetical protein [Streptomyces syringium]|uniref:hypothetical protein n=1 Tax=Streptomyces syringium TaxID=76729 RepID=UPI00341ED25A
MSIFRKSYLTVAAALAVAVMGGLASPAQADISARADSGSLLDLDADINIGGYGYGYKQGGGLLDLDLDLDLLRGYGGGYRPPSPRY